MTPKEATARIKINQLLEQAGWRFADTPTGHANVVLENYAKLSDSDEGLTKTRPGFIDYLLLDNQGFPLAVLEAKRPGKNPLTGKEQARHYAQSQRCRFVILSNGETHYLWDVEAGQPVKVATLPSLTDLVGKTVEAVNLPSLIHEVVQADYIARTQKPDYDKDPRWLDERQRSSYLEENRLSFLRDYQVQAIQSLQAAVKQGKQRFLFEMATGTGKTLTAAAIMQLFLRTGQARRVLFLVDRLELEEQAKKALERYFKDSGTYQTCIYKENRDEWRKAEIVISTVQSLLFKDKYQQCFAPTDFGLLISDEAHRSISGTSSRAVFEYFSGYKLGLTATPKHYLKQINLDQLNAQDPRVLERRQWLDTYSTFGCDNGKPTFSYGLREGVQEGFLVNLTAVDARTQITTQLLSDQGYAVAAMIAEEGEMEEQCFGIRDFEKKFISEETNYSFCQTFFEHALRDPFTGEMGKTIVFCVNQLHAIKITQILNDLADHWFPNRYQSDFAIQVTSSVTDAQTFAAQFANNRLQGYGLFNPLYKTSKTRVCVTVRMMATGYDCPDLLNVCLMRPIFSPTEFIQIKGRGTRKFNFSLLEQRISKTCFKLFDFFANCEYFEEKFNYDEVLKLPAPGASKTFRFVEVGEHEARYENTAPDPLTSIQSFEVGAEGMKIDRKFFEHAAASPSQEDNIEKEFEIFRRLHLIQEGAGWEEDIKLFFKTYFTDSEFRDIIDTRQYALLNTHPNGKVLKQVFGKLSDAVKGIVIKYIKGRDKPRQESKA